MADSGVGSGVIGTGVLLGGSFSVRCVNVATVFLYN